MSLSFQRFGMLFLAVLIVSSVGLHVSADVAAVPGTEIFTVHGPDGHLLRGMALKAYPDNPGPSSTLLPTAPTDAQGRLTVSLPIGLERLWIVAPGIGFGSTGTVVIRPGQTLAVQMPLLAPFAQICGTLPADLLKPGETVQVQNSQYGPAWAVAPAPVDAHGNFTLTDVFPGQVQITVKGGPQNTTIYTSVEVAPGESCTSIVFKATPASNFHPMMFPEAPEYKTIAIRGLVTDDHGHSVAGATVSADVPKPEPQGSWRLDGPFDFQSLVLSAQTNSDGSYVIPNVSVNTNTTDIPISVALAGHPPGLGDAIRAAKSSNDLQGNLVLSSQHTAVIVRVRKNGQPVPGITVNIGENQGPPVSMPDSSYGSLFWNENNRSLISLSAATGPDGTARFVDLTPGLWNAQAVQGPFFNALSSESQGVSVQAGSVAECDLNFPAASASVLPLQITTPQGHPAVGRYIEIQTTKLPEIGGGNQMMPDASGRIVDTGAFTGPGLWRVHTQYRDYDLAPINWFPETAEPFDAAGALVAVSPALPAPGLLALQAAAYSSGSIHAHLQDTNGHAAHGTVVILGFAGNTDYAASTDKNGDVVFSDMPSGKYVLQGYISGQSPPPTLSDTSNQTPLPPDTALSGQLLITPVSLTVSANQVTEAVLRAHLVGYIRGNIPSMLPASSHYQIFPTYLTQNGITLSQAIINDTTGEFVDGPFAPGPVSLPLFSYTPQGSNTRVAMVTANVAAGRVVSASVIPAPPYSNTETTSALANPVTGTVCFSDGHTPAWRAQTVLYLPSPDADYPRGTFLPQKPTDALGRLPGIAAQSGYGGFGGDQKPPVPSGTSPLTPVLVTWMPGMTGAAITPYMHGQEVQIVLPAPLNVSGRVTVSSRSVAGMGSTFEIRAAYQGHGELNQLLSRDAVAQPDGTFVLPGMTPGTYLVQAARDGIWLSATQTLVVGNGPTPPVSLDIGVPGTPVIVHLTDAHGNPLTGQDATLDIPSGPLTEILWPNSVTSDGAGNCHLDGLTAGPHIIFPAGLPPVKFFVSPVLGLAPGGTP